MLYLGLSCPVFPVQVSVTDSFRQVRRLYQFAAFQVGDGARHFQYAVVGTCRKVQPVHGILEHGKPFLIRTGVERQQLAVHLRIALYTGNVCVSGFLNLPGIYHTLSYRGARLTRAGVRHLFKGEWGDFDLQVYAVE